MGINVIAIICGLIAVLAGGYVIWIEYGPKKKDDDKNPENKENSDKLN